MDPDRVRQWAWVDRDRNDAIGLRAILIAAQLAVAAFTGSPQWGRHTRRLSRTLPHRIARIEGGKNERIPVLSAQYGPIEFEASEAGLRCKERSLRGMWSWVDVSVEGPLRHESETAGMPRIHDERPVVAFLGGKRVSAIVDLCDVALLCVMSGWQGDVDAWRFAS